MKIFLFSVLWLIALSGYAQSVTTFILVRHAEKAVDGTKDPELSDEGKKRALSLVSLLSKQKIDALYSTKFKRTENTILPLAKSTGLSIQHYDGSKMDEVDNILAKHNGQTIVMVGHSNTTPIIANYLTSSQLKIFDDGEYGNVLIVSVIKKGEGKITWIHY